MPVVALLLSITEPPKQNAVADAGVMTGTEGIAGCGVTVTTVAVLAHPLVFLAVTLYVPATTPVNIPVVLV